MIAAHYEEDPESFNEEIRQLDQLREVSKVALLSAVWLRCHLRAEAIWPWLVPSHTAM